MSGRAVELPSTVEYLLEEGPTAEANPREWLQFIQTRREDLVREAEWTTENFEYASPSAAESGQLQISAAGSIDPFAPDAKCLSASCRLAIADNFARTICLYADVVAVTDLFSRAFLPIERWTSGEAVRQAAAGLVLRRLEPLVRSGAIRFQSGWIGYCSDCKRKFDNGVEVLVEEQLIARADELQIAIDGRDVVLDFGRTLGEGVLLQSRLTKKKLATMLASETAAREYALGVLRRHLWHRVRGTLIQARLAADSGCVLGTGSYLESVALARVDPAIDHSDLHIDALEQRGLTMLPWVGELTVDQVEIVRREAARALPRFRARLAACCSAPGGDDRVARLESAVNELREQAEEVKAELEAIHVNDGRRSLQRLAAGSVLALNVLGIAAGAVSPFLGVGALVGLLGLLHSTHASADQERARLKSLPAYVLLRAKELRCQ